MRGGDELQRDLRVDTKVTARGAPLTSRVKRAEMTSSIGAGVLGADIALLLPNGFQAYALPSLALGLVMHVRGRYDKHVAPGDEAATSLRAT